MREVFYSSENESSFDLGIDVTLWWRDTEAGNIVPSTARNNQMTRKIKIC